MGEKGGMNPPTGYFLPFSFFAAGFFTAFFVDSVALDGKYLTDIREVEVVVQLSRRPIGT